MVLKISRYGFAEGSIPSAGIPGTDAGIKKIKFAEVKNYDEQKTFPDGNNGKHTFGWVRSKKSPG